MEDTFKQIRLRIYKAMLYYFESDFTPKRGFCYAIRALGCDAHNFPEYILLFSCVDLDDLHELNHQEPQHNSMYWWPVEDTQKRIDALNIAISQLS